jgi:putative glycerol-1-phosphate prenyltransferase
MRLLESIQLHRRTLGILVDPDKLNEDGFPAFAKALQKLSPHLSQKLSLDQIILLIGGSSMENLDLDPWLLKLRELIDLPVLLFPGSHAQTSSNADALMFLNLISGRNPDYLIGHQVGAISRLKNTSLEIIPTAYMLLDGGHESAVQRVTNTLPMPQDDLQAILDTALAGQYMGNELLYLEAGSGARLPAALNIVSQVVNTVDVPVVVGGGLRKLNHIDKRFIAGASMVVIGTALEEDLDWNG